MTNEKTKEEIIALLSSEPQTPKWPERLFVALLSLIALLGIVVVIHGSVEPNWWQIVVGVALYIVSSNVLIFTRASHKEN